MSDTTAPREIPYADLPDKLTHIPDPPAQLYLRGASIDDSIPTLAVVGSRKMSEYGRRACEKLIEGLRGYRVQIVSGLAYGIDSTAHRAALRVGLHSIAVPGSGVDDRVLYPRIHRNLAHEILAADGTVLSEFEPQQRALKWTFPQRNRIMAGLSDATLLIEAAEKSGTLITARLALEYDRDVLVVPGEIFSTTSRGTNALLRDGAAPVLESTDIIEHLDLEKVSSPTHSGSTSDERSDLLTLFENKIDRDELLRESGDAKEAQIELSRLEITGAIEIRNGVIYKK